MEVCGNSKEFPARIRSVQVATRFVGVVSLLGGVTKVSWHLPHSLIGLVCVFGRKPRFGVEPA